MTANVTSRLALIIILLICYCCKEDSTSEPPPVPETCPTSVSYEGKTYNTVKIGEQCWLKENLDVGTMSDSLQSASNNGTIEKYCFRNDVNNCNIYGGLYQWNEAMQYLAVEGAQGICPSGWHIPTLDEFQTLAKTVNNDSNALKAVGQGTGDGTGTNTSGFSALLAGFCKYSNFYDLGNHTSFWSSTETITDFAYYVTLLSNNSYVYSNDFDKKFGFSIRCVKD